MRFRSVVVLLRRRADSKTLTGVLELLHPDGDRIVEFHYRVVRAWEQPVEPLLNGPLATLPMAPLANVPLEDLPGVFEQIDARLMVETSPAEAATMMARTLTLAGARLNPDQIDVLGRRLRSMDLLRDSSFYKWMIREGLKEGEKKGQLREARKLLIRLGRTHCGPLDKATRTAIESIDDLKRLERMFERVPDASSWADVLAESK